MLPHPAWPHQECCRHVSAWRASENAGPIPSSPELGRPLQRRTKPKARIGGPTGRCGRGCIVEDVLSSGLVADIGLPPGGNFVPLKRHSLFPSRTLASRRSNVVAPWELPRSPAQTSNHSSTSRIAEGSLQACPRTRCNQRQLSVDPILEQQHAARQDFHSSPVRTLISLSCPYVFRPPNVVTFDPVAPTNSDRRFITNSLTPVYAQISIGQRGNLRAHLYICPHMRS